MRNGFLIWFSAPPCRIETRSSGGDITTADKIGCGGLLEARNEAAVVHSQPVDCISLHFREIHIVFDRVVFFLELSATLNSNERLLPYLQIAWNYGI